MYGILEKLDLPRPVIVVTRPVLSYTVGKSKKYEQYKLIVSIPKMIKDFRFIIIPVTDEELSKVIREISIVEFRHSIAERYRL